MNQVRSEAWDPLAYSDSLPAEVAGAVIKRDILKFQQDQIKKGKDASKLPAHLNNLNGLYDYWKTNEIIEKGKGLRITRNPLGIQGDRLTEFVSSPKILEYKYTVDALLDDFEKDKTEKNIGLVVAWEMGNSWEKRYEVIPLLYLGNLHHRYFHGATHIFKDSRTGDHVFPAIILSELIAYINNPDGVQEYQKKAYVDFEKEGL